MTAAVIISLIAVIATAADIVWAVRLRRKDSVIKRRIEIKSSYVVTDSDLMRYDTDQAIYSVARSRIAHNIAYDIVKEFKPQKTKNSMGKTVYTYKFIVMQ